MIQEERAEANYLAEYQEELEIEEAMEAHDRAERGKTSEDTVLDGNRSADEAS